MKDKTPKTNPKANSVDQIRNILFGEQIDIIEQRFSQLEANLTEAISQLSKKLDTEIQSLGDQLKKVDSNLQNENASSAQQQAEDLKNVERSLNNKIIETESDVLNQIQSGLEKLDNKTSDNAVLAGLLKNMADKLLGK